MRSDSIKITVTFPLAHGPFQTEVPPETTAGTVRTSALTFFGVSEDPGSTYFLTHAGERESDERTVGAIAGHAHALKFTLGKELTQG